MVIVRLLEGNLNKWMSVKDIQEATGCDIELLVIGLSQSAAKIPGKGYVVNLKDIKDHLVLAREIANSLLGAFPEKEKEKKELPEKGKIKQTDGWLPGKQVAEKAKVSMEDIVKLIDSGVLSAKRRGRGWLIDPKELERIPKLLQCPGPPKNGGNGPVPGFARDSPKDYSGEKQTSFGDETQKEKDSAPLPVASPQSDTKTRTVTIKARNGGCAINDVAAALGVQADTVQKWIKNKVVEMTDGGNRIEQESLRAFLTKQGRADAVTFESIRGIPTL